MGFSEFFGRDAFFAAEYTIEVRLVVESTFVGNFYDRFGCVYQQAGSMTESHQKDIINHTSSGS